MRGPLWRGDVLLLDLGSAFSVSFVKIIELYISDLCSSLYIYNVCFNKKLTKRIKEK